MLSKKFDTFLFLLGVFLIPFDNLAIAPSNGWATVAPIIFFLYALLNVRYIRPRKEIVLSCLMVILICLINFLRYAPVFENVVSVLETLILGVSFYFAMKVFFLEKNNKADLFLKTILISYSIAFVYGLFQVLNIAPLNSLMSLIEKRHYDRLSFSFTEPSFISMHIYGILLPLTIIFKDNKKYTKKNMILIALFVLLTIALGSSGRMLLDTLIIFLLYFLTEFYRGWLTNRKIFFSFGFVGLGFLLIFAFRNSERMDAIFTQGVYYDASLASRYFRIQAIFYGLIEKPLNFLFGFGAGNTFYPFNLGYSFSLSQYTNSYTYEVIGLYGTTEAQFFCGHLRLIAEFGLLIYIYILFKLFKFKGKNVFFLLLTFYLYIQFDSYAWYTIWIYLFFAACQKHRKKVFK